MKKNIFAFAVLSSIFLGQAALAASCTLYFQPNATRWPTSPIYTLTFQPWRDAGTLNGTAVNWSSNSKPAQPVAVTLTDCNPGQGVVGPYVKIEAPYNYPQLPGLRSDEPVYPTICLADLGTLGSQANPIPVYDFAAWGAENAKCCGGVDYREHAPLATKACGTAESKSCAAPCPVPSMPLLRSSMHPASKQ
jgi:hypothetical protein